MTRNSKDGINCMALFYKVGSTINNFLRKEKCRILPSSYSEKKFGKLYFHFFFNINIESTNNYITGDFEISKNKSHHQVLFFNISSP